jgi:glycosyltransferase involved in cell wall biosynthesis
VATHIPYPVECGGTTHIRGVVQELMQRGHEVVLCANVGDGLPEGTVEGMRTHRFRWRYRDVGVSKAMHRWAHGLRVARLAKDHGVDIIYERESSMGSGALASQLSKLPLVVEVNDLWWTTLSLRQASRIVSHSGGVRTIIPQEFHGKTIWVHAAVDTGPYTDIGPMAIEGLEGRKVVGNTGSLLAWHGAPELAAALPVLLESEPRATYLMVGKPTSDIAIDNLELIRSAARDAGVPEAVVTTGRVPHTDIPGVLAACDLCVAPYDPSGEAELERYGFWYSPMKLWEYMAAGRAVVSTDLPNIREIVGEDRGVLVPPGDANALAGAMVELLADDGARRAMGEAGRRFVAQNTWEHRVDDYERALVEALQGGK